MDFSKKFKIKNFRGDIEPHEVFLDKLAKKREEEFGITEKKLEIPIQEQLSYIILGIFFACLFVFLFKLFYLQIVEGKNYSVLSDNNKTRISFIRPERGVIYDKNLKQLVFNSSAFDLVCDKRDLFSSSEDSTRIVEEVAQIVGKDVQTLKKEIEDSEKPKVLIAENLSHETLLLLETKIKELPGFEIEESTVRDYISGPLFSHLLGFTGKISSQEMNSLIDYSISDSIGKTGIEKSYEEILRGKPGKIEKEKDALGRKKSEELSSLPEEGKSLVLYLDADLQEKIFTELEKTLQNVGAKKAAAVALDPNTGGILAMVSLPSFDNNLFSKGISPDELQKIQNNSLQPFFNRVVSGQYSVGSTIKPLLASAALQEKIISPEEKINCEGVISIKNPYYPEVEPEYYYYNDWKVHGITDMRKAIAESCNIYFYRLGGGYKDFKGLGAERISKYLSLFGWGKKTEVDMPGEAAGLIPDPSWQGQIGDIYHLSIGQSYVLASPLQVATAFMAIANAGTIYKPRIVQKIIDSEKKTVLDSKPEILCQNFIDPQNLQVVREGMRAGVTYGSSVLLNSLPVKAAAKTGTAQTPKDNYYHNWITVFAPSENPQIVLTIIIEDVEGKLGAPIPAARDILEWYFKK